MDYPHFKDGKSEAQRSYVTSLVSYMLVNDKAGLFEPRQIGSRCYVLDRPLYSPAFCRTDESSEGHQRENLLSSDSEGHRAQQSEFPFPGSIQGTGLRGFQ